mgnify:FL=1
MRAFAIRLFCAVGLLLAGRPSLHALRVIEASDHLAREGEAFRDPRASNGRCAGALFDINAEHIPVKRIVRASPDLPPGDYTATFWLTAAPVAIQHGLSVTLTAGETQVTLGQFYFDPVPEYQPYEIAFVHPGGPATLRLEATTSSGFQGMRMTMADDERSSLPVLPDQRNPLADADSKREAITAAEIGELIEGVRDVSQLDASAPRVLCDRIEIRLRRQANALVRQVEVDKIHYKPGEIVHARLTMEARGTPRPIVLVAEEIRELDEAREVYRESLTLEAGVHERSFAYPLDETEFGRELRCSLWHGDRVEHANSAFFGVSRNVYRIGISGNGGPQDMRGMTREQADALMAANKKAYANYFERFAWAPCDYSNLAPDTEIFYSGQTQYPGSVSGFKNLLAAAHAVGIKGITYGKTCAGGIAGFRTFQRHPEFFGHSPEGPATEQFNTFYLERMLANDYLLHAPPSEGGWQHWASLWVRFDYEPAVIFGAQAIMDSIALFGWDGVRWDGHFVGHMKPFFDNLRPRYPEFVHGYNIAFANPGGSHFLPPANAVEDFHFVARDHGLMMDESVRDWSHSNFSPGHIRPFYVALAREADYIKRIGGLPLFITFDMGSSQDIMWGVLFGLAAGQRYCYRTSPGDFLFGPLPRFLTRYSAFIWDDTARLAHPDAVLRLAQENQGVAEESLWWKESTWLRRVAPGRVQLLVNLINPPRYRQFSSRVQTPATSRTNIVLELTLPPGTRLIRAAHLSPDLCLGHETLPVTGPKAKPAVTLTRLHRWSIVLFELEGGDDPPFALTTPIEEAADLLARQAAELGRRDAERQTAAGIAPGEPAPSPSRTVPPYKDYERAFNADAEAGAALKLPASLSIRRDGRLDVHHARGPFAWLNPVEAAAARMAASASTTASWVDFVGFRAGPQGCMDDFPETFEDLAAYDVIVLDNIHAFHLGPQRRALLREYVQAGGGLLIMGGYFNLSLGADHNTALADLLPIRIRRYHDIRRDDNGWPLRPVEKTFFIPGINWDRPAHAYSVDASPLKEDAKVLLTAGDAPAIVSCPFGNGRVIVVLINPHGAPAEGTTPYWEWPWWPHILQSCLQWLGKEAGRVVSDRDRRPRAPDPSKPTAEDLMLDALVSSDAEFTTKLRDARVNIVDRESARRMLHVAVGHVGKIVDMDLLSDVIARTAPYFDPSFAELAPALIASPHDFIRAAGYQIAGLAGDRTLRPRLEKGLDETHENLVREALIALGQLGLPEAVPAVRRCLQQRPSHALLAHSVLLRLGDASALEETLKIYEEGMRRRLRLKSGRRSAHQTLYGGVSFKLTPRPATGSDGRIPPGRRP